MITQFIMVQKFAVNAITQQARRELAHTNIRFSLIEPAIVNTNLLSTVKNQKIKDEYFNSKEVLIMV
ncbi:SDR family NAD(P)-dependent oxidoreductase, partial [Mycoplasmopsis bovis]|uniref:SDR family NAD(P)-dependent oxidoreductase n=1 Tax=Mycoplasmopsis bovis TaxID=28903 RepID=UPI003D2C6A23